MPTLAKSEVVTLLEEIAADRAERVTKGDLREFWVVVVVAVVVGGLGFLTQLVWTVHSWRRDRRVGKLMTSLLCYDTVLTIHRRADCAAGRGGGAGDSLHLR